MSKRVRTESEQSLLDCVEEISGYIKDLRIIQKRIREAVKNGEELNEDEISLYTDCLGTSVVFLNRLTQ
jgi:hypothetical protein